MPSSTAGGDGIIAEISDLFDGRVADLFMREPADLCQLVDGQTGMRLDRKPEPPFVFTAAVYQLLCRSHSAAHDIGPIGKCFSFVLSQSGDDATTERGRRLGQ